MSLYPTTLYQKNINFYLEEFTYIFDPKNSAIAGFNGIANFCFEHKLYLNLYFMHQK